MKTVTQTQCYLYVGIKLPPIRVVMITHFTTFLQLIGAVEINFHHSVTNDTIHQRLKYVLI